MVQKFAGLLCAVVFAAAAAQADEVSFSGYSNAAFNGLPPNSAAVQTASFAGLTYTNSTFSNTSVNGFAGFGGNPTFFGTQSIDNFGSLTLGSSAAVYDGTTLNLRLTFTAPAGINGGNTSIYTANLVGSVSAAGNGGVFINFDNTPQTFTFSSGSANGSFSLTVNDLAINPGQTEAITGQITGASQTAVPEPSTLGLLGLGLAFAGWASRRRLR